MVCVSIRGNICKGRKKDYGKKKTKLNIERDSEGVLMGLIIKLQWPKPKDPEFQQDGPA